MVVEVRSSISSCRIVGRHGRDRRHVRWLRGVPGLCPESRGSIWNSNPATSRSHATPIAWSTSAPRPGSTNRAASKASPTRTASTGKSPATVPSSRTREPSQLANARHMCREVARQRSAITCSSSMRANTASAWAATPAGTLLLPRLLSSADRAGRQMYPSGQLDLIRLPLEILRAASFPNQTRDSSVRCPHRCVTAVAISCEHTQLEAFGLRGRVNRVCHDPNDSPRGDVRSCREEIPPGPRASPVRRLLGRCWRLRQHRADTGGTITPCRRSRMSRVSRSEHG